MSFTVKHLSFLLFLLLGTPSHALQETRCTIQADIIRDDLSGIQTYHEPITIQLTDKILRGYASTRTQDKTAFDRLELALKTRFSQGCMLQILVDEPETQIFILYSEEGDRFGRIFAPIARWPQSDISIEQQEAKFVEILEIISETAVLSGKDAFIESIWKSADFSKVLTSDSVEVYAWGVPPDFVDITFSDHNEQNCDFFPVQGWMARQICP
ncbi:hypothetical protein [Poseidonocella sedimentorum]|uniref:Group 4 capsule polysaccharide lipoprotein gfcB, YjbF n=1 Tax=Poseidonocella sedimentorum TaxID=871652 RepID=A0A1I6ESS1_9RHOB|nr:hypothetical protein [Poseidonocella sedimentorum]SFR20627.1 hypothetical protein SAMN04515673_1251 [Poseidonocella sedimentorum]